MMEISPQKQMPDSDRKYYRICTCRKYIEQSGDNDTESLLQGVVLAIAENYSKVKHQLDKTDPPLGYWGIFSEDVKDQGGSPKSFNVWLGFKSSTVDGW